MRYSLWSHNRLVAHTALDIPCVQDHLRQGFLDPTPEGQRLLVDATGVFAICARRPRNFSEWSKDDAYLAAFTRAVERREALDLVLRDEAGAIFECDFIRVYDLYDLSRQIDADDDSDEREAPWLDPLDEEDEIDSDLVTEMEEDWSTTDDLDLYTPGWIPHDERWDTMQYHIQVFLKRPDDFWSHL